MESLSSTQLSWLDDVATGPRPMVLLVESDENVARVLRRALLKAGCQVELVLDPLAQLSRLLVAAPSWDVIIIDLELACLDGLDLKRQLRHAGSVAPTLILSADATAATAVRCLQAGALQYLTKPVPIDDLVAKVHSAASLATMRRVALGADPSTSTAAPRIIGQTPPIARLRTAIHRFGRQAMPILLHGESGTGKELVARALHDASPRAAGPFVAVNLAALPESLIDSELFGHVKGAFTGATGEHPGVLQSADGGTLLLDEIGDMPLAMQGRLLRFLQEGEVRAVGANASHAVDVRVIAATHIDLQAAVAAGRFREDLYYRLNVAPLTVPPLRERLGDVALLTAHFFRKHGGDRRCLLTTAALELLQAQPWPGNVRQLENTLRNAMALAVGDVIDVNEFPVAMRQLAAMAPPPPAEFARGSGIMRQPDVLPDLRPLADARREASASFERHYLTEVLALARGSISEAARLAGVDRANFRRLLRRHGVQPGPRGDD